jgi:hypothetical protein
MALLIIVWGCFRNYMRAKIANLNAGYWALITFLMILAGWIIGVFLVVIMMMMKDEQLRKMLLQSAPREEIVEYIGNMNLLISEIFLFVCSIGGYLFVRYLIIRKTPVAGPPRDINDPNQ